MADNAITISVDGRDVRTLRDILPDTPGLKALFVGKTPAPISVDAGHYFQGSHGQNFWRRLRQYGLLKVRSLYEDDSLLEHGYGLTDIVKVPRSFGNEPSDAEYSAGVERIISLAQTHRPRVVVFVYKGVLDKVLKLKFGVTKKSVYGLNPEHDEKFGAPVFVFPLPGVGTCTRDQAISAMNDLRGILREN